MAFATGFYPLLNVVYFSLTGQYNYAVNSVDKGTIPIPNIGYIFTFRNKKSLLI